jgi:hypothetical protein
MRRYGMLLMQGSHGENLTKTNQSVFIMQGMMKDAMLCWSWEWILEEAQVQENLTLRLDQEDTSLGDMSVPWVHYKHFSCTSCSSML